MQCEQPAALRSSAAGSFQAVTPLPPQAPEEESRPSTSRYGFAVVIPACYSSTPPPGRIPPEVFRAGRRQPFRLLAQTLSVWSTATPFPKLPKTAPERQCQAFGRERTTFDPAMGRPGPGPGGRLPTLRAGLFRCSREPEVSLPRRSRARRPFPFQTASGATLHSLHSLRSFRALWHWQTNSRRTRPPLRPSRLRDCQHHRPALDVRPKVCAISTLLPRPDGWEWCIYIYRVAAAAAAAGDVNARNPL